MVAIIIIAYVIIPTNIAIIVAFELPITLIKVLCIKYAAIPIVPAENSGLNMCFENLMSSLIYLLRYQLQIIKFIPWHTVELIGEPNMFILGLLTRIIFKIVFTPAPIANAIAGICVFPKPYKPPFIT